MVQNHHHRNSQILYLLKKKQTSPDVDSIRYVENSVVFPRLLHQKPTENSLILRAGIDAVRSRQIGYCNGFAFVIVIPCVAFHCNSCIIPCLLLSVTEMIKNGGFSYIRVSYEQYIFSLFRHQSIYSTKINLASSLRRATQVSSSPYSTYRGPLNGAL